jgi:hypothetical protein
MRVDSAKCLQDRTRLLRDTAAAVGAKFEDEATRDYLMRPVRHALDDLEAFAVPCASRAADSSTWLQAGGFRLQEGQLALDHAEEMILLYGVALQLTA